MHPALLAAHWCTRGAGGGRRPARRDPQDGHPRGGTPLRHQRRGAGAPGRVSLDVEVLTIFPHMFPGPLGDSITGRALSEGLVTVRAVDIRRFATDRHRTVDDYPYGGGPGMVMRPGPVIEAIESVRRPESRVMLLAPTGRTFSQQIANELASEKHLVLVCGRYEGVDERVRLLGNAEELSIGDFVLTGGELPAMVVLDAIIRLLPGVLSSSEAWRDESHARGLLQFPQSPRPTH